MLAEAKIESAAELSNRTNRILQRFQIEQFRSENATI